MFVRSTPLRAASRKFILLPPREMRVQFQPPEAPPSRTVSFNETMPATEAQHSSPPPPPPPQSDEPVRRIPVK